MTADMIPAQVQAIGLAYIAASLAANLALCNGDTTGIYREAAIRELAKAHEALNIIAAALACDTLEVAA